MSDSTDYWLCRRSALGHAWEPYEAPFDRPGQRVWKHRDTSLCVRCGTIRHRLLDALGDVVANQYLHPDGYKFPKDEAPTSGELRLLLAGLPRRRTIKEKP